MSPQDEFLESQEILRLATLGADGTPHVVPVWYAYRDGIFHVGTELGTVHAKNALRDCRVAFCIDRGVHAPEIRGVTGRGMARVITDMRIVEPRARMILAKYFEDIRNPGAQELLRSTDCIMEIEPEHTASWRY